jgi:L,D-peptidoglycan transpeptidase YkuD (ErfK/YbiS/YcfS/YnhG family)
MMTDFRPPRQIFGVRRSPGKPGQGILSLRGLTLRCSIGRGGISARKREGDGATPLADLAVLSGYARNDGIVPRRGRLGLAPIGPDLGWCDASADRNYNRPVRLPYPAGHERMQRADGLYDICLVLDWNIRPRRRNRGSAIFVHIARPGYLPTEGCIALSPRDMARLLPLISARTVFRVQS